MDQLDGLVQVHLVLSLSLQLSRDGLLDKLDLLLSDLVQLLDLLNLSLLSLEQLLTLLLAHLDLANLLLSLLDLDLQFGHDWCLHWHVLDQVVDLRVNGLLQLHLDFVHLLHLFLWHGWHLNTLLLQLLGSLEGGLGSDLLVLWGNHHDLLNQLDLLLSDLLQQLALLLLLGSLDLNLLDLTLDWGNLLLQLLDQGLDLEGSLLEDGLLTSQVSLSLLLSLLDNSDLLLQLQLHLLDLLLLLSVQFQLSLSWLVLAGGELLLLGHDLCLQLHDGGLHVSNWHLLGSMGNHGWHGWHLLLLLSLQLELELLLLLLDHGVELLLQLHLHVEHLLLHLDLLILDLSLDLLHLLDHEGDQVLLLTNLSLEFDGVQGGQVLLSKELLEGNNSLLLSLDELLDHGEELLLQSQLQLLDLLLAQDGLSDLLLLLLLVDSLDWASVQWVLLSQLLLGLHNLDQLLLLVQQSLLLFLTIDLGNGKVLDVEVSSDLHLLLLGLDDLLGNLLQLSDSQLSLTVQESLGDLALDHQLGLLLLDGNLLLDGLSQLLDWGSGQLEGLLLLGNDLTLQLLQLLLQLDHNLWLGVLSLDKLDGLGQLLLLTLLGHVGVQLLSGESLLQLLDQLLDGQLVSGDWGLLSLLMNNSGSGLDGRHDVLSDLDGGQSLLLLLNNWQLLLLLASLSLVALGDHEALAHALAGGGVLNIDKLIHVLLVHVHFVA